MQFLGAFKNDRMISVHFRGKPFNITIIQVYVPTSNTEEAEIERFYEDLQDLLELTPPKRCPFHYRGLECNVGSQEIPGVSSVQFSSVAQSCPTLWDPMNRSMPGLAIHHQLPEFTQTHVHRVSDAIQPSHPLSSPSPPPPMPPSIRVFSMSQLFAWGGQSTGVSALASFLPKKSQGWSPSDWTDWISLQSKGLSRVLSNTTVQKHQFFFTQRSSQSNSHIHTWPQEKP